MRVNSKVFTERTDMLSDIVIPNCSPKELSIVTERLINMIVKVGYSVGSYNSVSDLVKKLTVDYWKEYDGLVSSTLNGTASFKLWYLHATSEDEIGRALRWLREHHYVYFDETVEERARKSEQSWRQSIKIGH